MHPPARRQHQAHRMGVRSHPPAAQLPVQDAQMGMMEEWSEEGIGRSR